MMAVSLCEKGPVRPSNQDAVLACTERGSGLYLVADGVGGSADGAAASSRIVKAYQSWWEQEFLPGPSRGFAELFAQIKAVAEQLNRELYAQYGAGQSCSTLALLFIHQKVCGCLSVGDSRIYGTNGKRCRLLTRDDVWENRAASQTITLTHAGKILSAVGGYEALEYSSITDELRNYRAFLLCSDGLYRFADPELLSQGLNRAARPRLFANRAAQQLVRQLERSALMHKTSDNYSAVLVCV